MGEAAPCPAWGNPGHGLKYGSSGIHFCTQAVNMLYIQAQHLQSLLRLGKARVSVPGNLAGKRQGITAAGTVGHCLSSTSSVVGAEAYS